MVHKKHRRKWNISNILVTMITNDAKCTREIKSRVALAKATFNEKKTYFQQQIGLKFKEGTSKVLNLEHRFVRCRDLDTGK
jgi:hypothetical protein